MSCAAYEVQVAQVGSSCEQHSRPPDSPSSAADLRAGVGAGGQAQNLLGGAGAASAAALHLPGTGFRQRRSEPNVDKCLDKWNWQSYSFKGSQRRVHIPVATAGVDYGFRVRANNSIGFSKISEYTFFKVPTCMSFRCLGSVQYLRLRVSSLLVHFLHMNEYILVNVFVHLSASDAISIL